MNTNSSAFKGDPTTPECTQLDAVAERPSECQKRPFATDGHCIEISWCDVCPFGMYVDALSLNGEQLRHDCLFCNCLKSQQPVTE